MRARTQRFNLKRRQALWGWLFVTPALLLFGLFSFYPIGSAFYTGFFRRNVLALTPPQYVGLQNYLDLFQSNAFWNAVRATAAFTLGTFIPLVVFSLALAVLIVSRSRFQRFFQLSLYSPAVVPGVVAALVWLLIFDPRGLANQWVNFVLGTPGIDHRWLASTAMTRLSTVVVYFWSYLGFFTIIFMAGLGSVSLSLREAARIDGANAWQEFWGVVFPILKPITLLVSIMAMIFCMRTFSVQYFFTQAGAPREPINVVTLFIYNTAIRDMWIGIASAMSILLLLTMFFFSWLQFRASREAR